jgi:hypothetical protein
VRALDSGIREKFGSEIALSIANGGIFIKFGFTLADESWRGTRKRDGGGPDSLGKRALGCGR